MAPAARRLRALRRALSDLLVVVPTLDEADLLPELVGRVFAAVPTAHLLIVDDRSPDGTAGVCRRLQEERPGLRLLVRQGPRGLGRSLSNGLCWGIERGYERLATLDADLSHDPAVLPALLSSPADVVIGSRYVAGGEIVSWGRWRRFLSRTANRFAARVLEQPWRDLTSGYRVYRRGALARARPEAVRSTGYGFLVELLFRLQQSGASVEERPIRFVERRAGCSKLSPLQIPRSAWRVVALWAEAEAIAPNRQNPSADLREAG